MYCFYLYLFFSEYGENILCGFGNSLYRLKAKSYDCMHIACPLHSFVCSPYIYYFKKRDLDKFVGCKSSDICAIKKCSDHEICLDFGETYECHCPEPDGKCGKQLQQMIKY